MKKWLASLKRTRKLSCRLEYEYHANLSAFIALDKRIIPTP